MNWLFCSVLGLSSFCPTTSNAEVSVAVNSGPSEVLIIRHAEKPPDDKGDHLSEKGRERAAQLPKLFSNDERFTEFGNPAAIYAASPVRKKGSVRSIETVEPLAKHLNISAITKFTSDEYKEIAKEILANESFNGKSVLIAWPNDEIPKLAKAFGVVKPGGWPKEIFDRVWRIRFKENKVSEFSNLPQKLLPGDAEE
jgi:hypothetical protein